MKLEARKLGGLAANLVHVKAKGLIGTVTIFALLKKIDFDFRESNKGYFSELSRIAMRCEMKRIGRLWPLRAAKVMLHVAAD